MNADDIRAEVNAICVHAFVTFHAAYIGQTKREKWECDEWRVTFKKEFAPGDSRSESFEFFTGLGLRADPTPQARAQARLSLPGLTQKDIDTRTIYGRRYLAEVERLRKPAPPHPADVLHSLILDSSAVGQSFESWCSDYGYDSDSRKAEAAYRACQQNADKLARIFNGNDIAALQTALEGY